MIPRGGDPYARVVVPDHKRIRPGTLRPDSDRSGTNGRATAGTALSRDRGAHDSDRGSHLSEKPAPGEVPRGQLHRMVPRGCPAIGKCAVFRPAGPNMLIQPIYPQSQSEGVRPASLRKRLVSPDLQNPIPRRIGEELTLPAEGTHHFFIDFDAQAWPCGNGDVTLNHEVPFVG